MRPRTSGKPRVNRDWRFYFLIQNDTYLIVTIIAQPPNDAAHVRANRAGPQGSGRLK